MVSFDLNPSSLLEAPERFYRIEEKPTPSRDYANILDLFIIM
jgi:hypothetical protein